MLIIQNDFLKDLLNAAHYVFAYSHNPELVPSKIWPPRRLPILEELSPGFDIPKQYWGWKSPFLRSLNVYTYLHNPQLVRSLKLGALGVC